MTKPTNKEKSKKGDELKDVVDLINKKFGNGTFWRIGTNERLKVETISSGSLNIDRILGGGYPSGRIVEIFGTESSGKTTLSLMATREVQKNRGHIAFIDMEHALDISYAEMLGVDVDNLYYCQPDYGEQALEIASTVISSGKFKLIIIDSVAALVPKREIDGDIGDQTVGCHAKLMAQAMRVLTPRLQQNSCTVIFINQVREKIGIMYGNPQVTTGGNSLKFAASQRLEVKKGLLIKDTSGKSIGQELVIKTVKNKISPPMQETRTTLLYGVGIDSIVELLDLAVDKNIITKSGSWYKYDGCNLAQGAQSTVALLKDNQELIDEIKEKVFKE